jgi:hypothetical protein
MRGEFLVRVRNFVCVTGPSFNELADAPIERVQPKYPLLRCHHEARVRVRFDRKAFQFFDSRFCIVGPTEHLPNLAYRTTGKTEIMDEGIPKHVVENLGGVMEIR